jgi:6-phospho-3-hexuloisomerase
MNVLREVMVRELTDVFYAIEEGQVQGLINLIVKADKIFVYSCGREALMLKAFAMRLHHLGFKVHVVGDVTVPAIGLNDLMLIVCGPGYVSTDIAMANIAKKSGASVAVMTANMEGEICGYCNHIVCIPAQTMAVKADQAKSSQPMGAVFEQAQLLIEEYIVVKLSEILKCSEEDMRKNHTVLE